MFIICGFCISLRLRSRPLTSGLFMSRLIMSSQFVYTLLANIFLSRFFRSRLFKSRAFISGLLASLLIFWRLISGFRSPHPNQLMPFLVGHMIVIRWGAIGIVLHYLRQCKRIAEWVSSHRRCGEGVLFRPRPVWARHSPCAPGEMGRSR